MNDDSLDQWLAHARANPPDTSRAGYGFETRLLARLREDRARLAGARVIWRCCPWLAAGVAALAVWTLAQPPDFSPTSLASQADDILLTELLTGTAP